MDHQVEPAAPRSAAPRQLVQPRRLGLQPGHLGPRQEGDAAVARERTCRASSPTHEEADPLAVPARRRTPRVGREPRVGVSRGACPPVDPAPEEARGRRPCPAARPPRSTRCTSRGEVRLEQQRPWCTLTATSSTAGPEPVEGVVDQGAIADRAQRLRPQAGQGRRRVPCPAASTTPTDAAAASRAAVAGHVGHDAP